MKRSIIVATALAVCIVVCGIAGADEKPVRKSKIQLAILLDTSGSMSGLINQAKTRLWAIVNEFATTKKNGITPDFEVALFEYGNDGLPAGEGYIRLILPLTTDLDKVSEELFALRTNGGQEYCGHVIQDATNRLAWSDSNEDLKVIFIAGNEPFTQGGVDFRKACPAAVAKGIVVNTIFCGNHDQGIKTFWQEGATLADGKYMSIDHNASVVSIPAPQDKKLAELSKRLNETYIPYGTRGKVAAENQLKQDANAARIAPSVSAQRALSKGSANYRNESWDLVDAQKMDAETLGKLKDADLPENMRKMNAEERKAYVDLKAAERAKLQNEIKALSAERERFIVEARKKMPKAEADTFDKAVNAAVREQAEAKNFNLKAE